MKSNFLNRDCTVVERTHINEFVVVEDGRRHSKHLKQEPDRTISRKSAATLYHDRVLIVRTALHDTIIIRTKIHAQFQALLNKWCKVASYICLLYAF